MTEALAARIEILEKNNTQLWAKHDECETDRKKEAVKLERVQGQANVLATKIDNIEKSTAKTEQLMVKMADKVDGLATSTAQTKGFVVGFKELIGILAAIASIIAVWYGVS